MWRTIVKKVVRGGSSSSRVLSTRPKEADTLRTEIPRGLRLHEALSDAKGILSSAPSLAEIDRVGKSISPSPEIIVEALYGLALHKRSGMYLKLGGRSTTALIKKAARTLASNYSVSELSAPQLVLALYSLRRLKQIHVLASTLPNVSSCLFANWNDLTPNEIAKISWALTCNSVMPDSLLQGDALLLQQHVAEHAAADSEFAHADLCTVAQGLCKVLAAASHRSAEQFPQFQFDTLDAMLNCIIGRLLDNASEDVDPELHRMLASGLRRLPAGSTAAARFAPYVASKLKPQEMSTQQLVGLDAYLRDHQHVLAPKTWEAFDTAVQARLSDAHSTLMKAMGLLSSSDEDYRKMLQNIQVRSFEDYGTRALLRKLGVGSMSEANVAEAESVLRDILALPRLDAHPLPHRDRTFAYVTWDVSENGHQLSVHKEIVWSGQREHELAKPLVALEKLADIDHNRAKDAEIQALSAFLRVIREKGVSVGPHSTLNGHVNLLVNQVPCVSCVGAMAQFRSLLPSIELRCSFVIDLGSDINKESLYSLGRSVEAKVSTSHPTFKQGMRVFDQMLANSEIPSVRSCHELLRLAVIEGRSNEALVLLDRMRKNSIRPERGTYMLLLFSVSAEHYFNVFQAMKDTGYTMQGSSLHKVLMHGKRIGVCAADLALVAQAQNAS